MLRPEHVVTFDECPEGFRLVRDLGHVSGQASRPRNLLRATFRSIGNFIGLPTLDYVTDAERARDESLAELCRRATSMGANGVVGLRFEATEGSDGSTRVSAYGTAVLLDPAPDGAR